MSDTRIKAAQFFGVIGHGTDGYFLMTNADGSMSWEAAGSPSPTISSISYPGDDLAADPAGGQTVTITGTNFASGATVTVGGTSASVVSFVSATELTFTTPTKTAGDYDLVVTNTDGGTATSVNGISYNGIPAWTTATGSLGTFASDTTISTITLQASEPDGGTITFSITNGALPTGLLLSGADIDGTTSIVNANTTYNFTVTATDDENQSTGRAFSITIEKYVLVSSENFTINTYTGNGSTQSIEGKIGTAAAFNGTTSQIRTVGNPIPSTSSLFSISFWFQLDNTNTNNHIFSIFDNVAGTNKLLLRSLSSGNFQAGVYDVNSNSNFITTTPSTFSYTTGVWYHLVYISTNTGDNEFWINGTQIATSSGVAANTTSSSVPITMGGRGDFGGSSTERFGGKLDQVRIFDKALSSGEVTTLYGENNASSTKSTTDIFDDGSGVALYEFEEGAKNTGAKKHYLHVSDAGGQNTSVRINSVDSEFTYARPTGYAEWGGSFDPNNTATDYVGSSSGFVFSESNKKWDKPTSNYFHSVWSTNGYSSGKYYVELEFLNADLIFGLSTSETADTVHSGASFYENAISYFSYTANKRVYSNTSVSGGAVLATNNVIGFAVDFDNTTLKYYINNTLVETETLAGYDGTPTNVSFVGTSFQPDLVWQKRRDGTYSHLFFDSVRGATNRLISNSTTSELSDANSLTSFDANGFTVGNLNNMNGSGGSMVAWCWKAGGAASLNENGSIDSQVSANQDAGFSIVSYTGNGSSGQTVGHGLSSAPEFIVVKSRNTVATTDPSWIVYHKDLTADYKLALHESAAAGTTGNWSNTEPTSNVFYILSNDAGTNANGGNFIAYCFHSVDGYQKVGSYSGGSTNTISTGFKPRFIIVKRTNRDGDDWHLFDSTREGDDSTDKILKPNTADSEGNGGADRTVNFTSDGFNWTNANSNAVNASGGEYIYLAIA